MSSPTIGGARTVQPGRGKSASGPFVRAAHPLASAPVQIGRANERPTILFVDDREHICGFWRRELEREGYTVLLANYAEDAIRVIERVRPDLVVTDVWLHGSDFGVLKRTLVRYPQIPVIVYTALTDCRHEISGLTLHRIVWKGDDLERLLEAVSFALAGRGRAVGGTSDAHAALRR